MTIHVDPVAIREASEPVENLLHLIKLLKPTRDIVNHATKVGVPVEREEQNFVLVFAAQLDRLIEIAREKYVGEGPVCIRAVAHRRPSSAHDTVLDVATQIAGVIHCFCPGTVGARKFSPQQTSSRFFAAIAGPVSSLTDIAGSELFADRDRAILNIEGKLPKPRLGLDDPSTKTKGVSLLDAALILNDGVKDGVEQRTIRRWHASQDPKLPECLGYDPRHSQRKLYELSKLLDFIEKTDGIEHADRCWNSLRQHLREVRIGTKKLLGKPSGPSAKSKQPKSQKSRKS